MEMALLGQGVSRGKGVRGCTISLRGALVHLHGAYGCIAKGSMDESRAFGEGATVCGFKPRLYIG